MNSKNKVLIIVGVSLLLVGCIILVGVMTALNWDFTKLSDVKYETNTYAFTEDYADITVDAETADIDFLVSENGTTYVECFEQTTVRHSVEVEGGKLSVKTIDTRKWYEHIGIFSNSPKIKVYMPAGNYERLQVKSSTGNVTLHKSFIFNSIDISTSTGNVSIFASANKSVKLHTTTGNVNVKNVSAGSIEVSVTTGKITLDNVTSDSDVTVTVSTGKTLLSDIRCSSLISDGSTGDLTLTNVTSSGKFSIKRSTGDVKIDKCDADEIFIETDTGDVVGTLLTEKIFIVDTDTGNIDVPKSVSGNRCEVTTDTGDIKISILR